MNFSRSRVLSTLLMCALAVAFSGVAEAQVCFTQASGANTVRAEGLTEVVGNVRVLCKRPSGPSSSDPFATGAVPASFKLALELNTRITNTISDTRVVQLAATATEGSPANAYTDGGITLMSTELDDTGRIVTSNPTIIAASRFGDGKLSADGTTITWTLAREDDADTEGTQGVNLGEGGTGFLLTISGVRANAATLGNGEDVMANVSVGGAAVNSAPMKLSDVSTGIDLALGKATGLECNKTSAVGTVTIKEGFATAWMAKPADSASMTAAFADTFVLTISNVPSGVKVTVPTKVDLETDKDDGGVNEMEGSVAIDLVMCRTCGADSAGVVELSTAGTGQVRYKIRTTEGASDNADMSTVQSNLSEWVHVPVTFSWDAGGAGLGAVNVNVGFHPMSNNGSDTFAVGGSAVPRFSEDGTDAAGVLTINDCMTTLFYPFVTSSSGYDTGIVVSNTSGGAGSCSATYSGSTDSMSLGEVMAGSQSIFLVSSHNEDFSGYLEVVCNTESASGFAHVVDTSGLAGSQGYIAQCSGGTGACK